MNLHSLEAEKSYCYLTQPDFIKAFDKNDTILITKDSKQFKFVFPDEDDANGRPIVLIQSEVVRPVKFLMVNSERKTVSRLGRKDLMTINKALNELESPEVDLNLENTKTPSKIDEILLFRRRKRVKKFTEHKEEELEELAEKLLSMKETSVKSKFQLAIDKQLEYPDPDFMEIVQPVDAAYEENYSFEAPSVHDLFDLDVPCLSEAEAAEEEEEQEMDPTHFVDQDEEMIEEYIIEDGNDDYDI